MKLTKNIVNFSCWRFPVAAALKDMSEVRNETPQVSLVSQHDEAVISVPKYL